MQSTALNLRESRKVLTEALREQRSGIVRAILIGVVWGAAKITVPRLTQLAIDRGIVRDGSLVGWSMLIVVAGLVAGLFTALRRYFSFTESRQLEQRLRNRIFEHVVHLHVGYHDHAQTGQLMSRASSDLQQVQGFVVMIPLTISNLLMVVGIIVILFLTQPLLALVALAPLPLVNLLSRRFSLRIHPTLVTVQQRQAQLATVVEESVTGVRVVKGFGAEQRQIDLLTIEANAIRQNSLGAARIRSAFLPGIDVLPALGQIAVLGIGGHRVIDGQMTIGELVAFNVYVALMIQPLRTIGMTVAFGQRAAAALTRIHEVLSTKSLVTSPANPTTLPSGPGGHVRFEGVRFAYDATACDATGYHGDACDGTGYDATAFDATGYDGTARDATGYDGTACVATACDGIGCDGIGHHGTARDATQGAAANAGMILDGFTLDVPAGRSIALVGATGSGKSTVARLLLRFYDPQSGGIRLDGCDLRELDLVELRRSVSVVFEDTFLFHDSVRANIAFARPDASMETIERAALLAGAADFIENLPSGYDTVLGERGYSLSGGQRQRIAIARAIVADPRVLILDDATSAVDPAKEHEIRDALATVMDGRTTIVIAHRPATIAMADMVVLLDRGRVAAVGEHQHLLDTEPLYRDVLSAWAATEPGSAIDEKVVAS